MRRPIWVGVGDMPGHNGIGHSRPELLPRPVPRSLVQIIRQPRVCVDGFWHNGSILHDVGIGNAHVMLYSKTDQLECNNHLRLWAIYLQFPSYEI